jgi:hypothetical protein
MSLRPSRTAFDKNLYERQARRDKARIAELEALINNPHTDNFLEAVRLEAAHQRERWKAEHDAGKSDADWLWLVAYLTTKALTKPDKRLHHIITAAAGLLNWHMQRTVGNTMRPGIDGSANDGEVDGT